MGMKKAEIIAVINQKGGTGKTTTALNLGQGLNIVGGYKVLLVDLDAQCNLSQAVKTNPSAQSILDLLLKKGEMEEAVQHGEYGDLIQGDNKLYAADILITGNGKEYRLKEILSGIKGYDYIVIDTAPNLNTLTINAFTCADCAVIPAVADMFNIKGIEAIGNTIGHIHQNTNKGLKIRGILLTRFNERFIINRDLSNVVSQTANKLKTAVFKTKIRENVTIRESQTMRENILRYAPTSNGAIDYRSFIKEYLNEA